MLGTGGITLGNQVMIAANTMIVANSHRIERTDIPIQDQGYSAKGIQIEDDVWIGANTTILDGVKISRGAVVGAGATVTKDVPPYSIVVGVPAQVKKYR
jgi:acetyltransferase-like isoleucine patch superfamily enzyme